MRWVLFVKGATITNSSLHKYCPQLLPEAISLDGSSKVQKQEFRFWGGSCVGLLGLFGPKDAFGSQKHVEEVSEDV